MERFLEEYEKKIYNFLNSYKDLYNIEFKRKIFGIPIKKENFNDYILGITAKKEKNGIELILKISDEIKLNNFKEKLIQEFNGYKIKYESENPKNNK